MSKIDFYHEKKLSNREIVGKTEHSPKIINNYVKNKENFGKNYEGKNIFDNVV